MFGYKSYTIFGWVIAAVLAVLGLRWGAEILFHTETPAKLGLAIELPEDTAPPEAEAPAELDLGTLLAAADVTKGEKLAKQCAACHNFDNGGANAIGPNLWGIPGSAIARRAGFAYSPAFREYAADRVWSYEELNTFLAAPSKTAPGTAMSFAGLKKPTDRADLMAYLNSVTAAPVAFPAPALPPAAAEGEVAPDAAAPAEETAPGADEGVAVPATGGEEVPAAPATPGAGTPPGQ